MSQTSMFGAGNDPGTSVIQRTARVTEAPSQSTVSVQLDDNKRVKQLSTTVRLAPWICPAIKLLEGPRTFGTRYGQW